MYAQKSSSNIRRTSESGASSIGDIMQLQAFVHHCDEGVICCRGELESDLVKAGCCEADSWIRGE